MREFKKNKQLLIKYESIHLHKIMISNTFQIVSSEELETELEL